MNTPIRPEGKRGSCGQIELHAPGGNTPTERFTLAFILQKNLNGQWQAATAKPFSKAITAFAMLGKFRNFERDREFRVFNDRTGQVAHPPKLEELLPFMYLRGYRIEAIDSAAAAISSGMGRK